MNNLRHSALPWVVAYVLFFVSDAFAAFQVPRHYRQAHPYWLIPGGGFVVMSQFNRER